MLFLVNLIVGFSITSCESIFKAHIINLAHRPNRLESITTQLNSYGIPFEVFTAISPADIEDERKSRLLNQTSGRFHPETKMIFRKRTKADNILSSQIGCTQSHLQILLKQSKVNSSAPFLILEDDALLEPNFYQRSVELFNKIKGPWDILHVGYCLAGFGDCDLNSERSNDYCKAKRYHISCTQGYFVNGSESAKVIVRHVNTPEPGIYDYILRFSTDNYYMSLPELVRINHTFISDNSDDAMKTLGLQD